MLLLPLCTLAQQGNDTIVHIDSLSNITIRQIDEKLVEKYSGDEFNYTIKTGESQNILVRFLNWIGQGFQRVFGIELSPQVVKLIEKFIYVLLFLFAIYLLIKVFTNESFNSIFTKKAKNLSTVNLSEEHIETIDLYSLLDAALTDQDYRLAIRYQFLITLQQLSKKDLITWNFEKTNSDYLSEIKIKSIQQGFNKVVYLYDYIWYGEQTINDINYKKYSKDFESINKQINI